jgi:hypothetical protein
MTMFEPILPRWAILAGLAIAAYFIWQFAR